MTTENVATLNGISSYQDLQKLNSSQLVNLFNSLPGVTAVKKFTSRTIGMNRIARLAGLEVPASLAVAKEGAAPAAPKAPKAKKAAKKAAKKTAKKARKATGPRVKAKGSLESGKKEEVIRQLGLTNGVSLEKIMDLTGWQKHTVRGFISVLGRTMKIESFKTDKGVRTYRAK